jgi:hypothetical protein
MNSSAREDEHASNYSRNRCPCTEITDNLIVARSSSSKHWRDHHSYVLVIQYYMLTVSHLSNVICGYWHARQLSQRQTPRFGVNSVVSDKTHKRVTFSSVHVWEQRFLYDLVHTYSSRYTITTTSIPQVNSI